RLPTFHRSGLGPLRSGRVRVAAARGRRPLPAPRGAGPRHRGDPALGEELGRGLDPDLPQIRHVGRGRPALVDAIVELLQAHLLSNGGLAAGVLHAQPLLVLAEDDEWLTAPRARRAYVAEVVDLRDRQDSDEPAGAYLLEALLRLRQVDPHVVAVRA